METAGDIQQTRSYLHVQALLHLNSSSPPSPSLSFSVRALKTRGRARVLNTHHQHEHSEEDILSTKMLIAYHPPAICA